MLLAALAIFALIYLALCAVWIWLCLGVRQRGYRKALGIVAIQLSFVVFVVFLFLGSVPGAFVYAGFPPLALVLFQEYVARFSDFVLPVMVLPLILGAATFGLFMTVKVLRPWSIVAAALVALPVFVVVGESRSKEQMCAAAKARGVGEFRRNTFLWSLQNTPREFQFEVHAIAEANGQRLAWSYRDLDWYTLNERTGVSVEAPLFRCSAS